MILPLIAASLAAAPTTATCPDLITPAALLCRAIKAQSEGRAVDSAQAFEQAALASNDQGSETSRVWAAAGNMWIVAGQYGRAAIAIDKALALGGLVGEQRGEALLDRARIAEAQNDLKTARAKLDEAGQTVSEDPFYWYFSSALAIREGDLPKAQSSINKALSMQPDDALILFEAGHVAHASGDDKSARDYWTRAQAADPKGDVGNSATKALNLLDHPPKDDAGAAKP